jgi:hypothetical protein
MVEREAIMITARLLLLWMQPIFWMLFFHHKDPEWASTEALIIPILAIVVIGITNIIDPSILWFVTNQRLIVSYSSVGLIFAWHLMNNKGWPFPQALSFSALCVFAASFYWEIPWLVRNAWVHGFEPDWALHILVIFPYWYLKNAVGWNRNYDTMGLVAIFCIGIVISTVFLYAKPIPPTGLVGNAWQFWDSPHYLANRVICTWLTFLLFNTDRSAISRYVNN